MTDLQLDEMLRGLDTHEPPKDVQRAVLAEVGVAPERVAELLGEPIRLRRPRRILWGVGAGLALAAGLLLALQSGPASVGDPEQLVARGAGGPGVTPFTVRVAVRRGETTERFAVGQVYHAGDTLIFRVTTMEATEVTLRRGSTTLYTGTVGPGDTDLPVAYQLESGEAAARFSVQAGDQVESIEIPAVAP